MQSNRLLSFLVLFTFVLSSMQAQVQSELDQALRYLESKTTEWNLESQDLNDLLVSDLYKTKHNGVTHVYFNQSIDGTPIKNAIAAVHLDKNGKAHTVGHRLISNAQSLVFNRSAKLQPIDALKSAVDHLQIVDAIVRENETETESEDVIFEGSNFSNSPIKVKPTYAFENGKLELAWDLSIDEKRSADYWNLTVSAIDGHVIDQHNYTVYCTFEHNHSSNCGKEISNITNETFNSVEEELTNINMGSSYRVFPLPAESPSHGSHDWTVDPFIPASSPNGWHDVDGDGTADYTITRGNNVHAYPDLDNNNQSTGGEPDGGTQLQFDYPYDETVPPIDILDAAVVNLFYMNNMMHDITYIFGFDEAAGNFQDNNLGNGGQGGDHVNAEAQDGGGLNNANFATPADGGNGRMQMFLWTSGGEVFTVLAPDEIAKGYESSEANFGPSIVGDNLDIEAEIVLALDDDPDFPSFCCNPIINGEDIDGKIALIDRGGCFFDYKVKNAEDNGAIAVIICNFENAPIGMGARPTGSPVITIPSISVGSDDCTTIRAYLGQGLIGKLKAPQTGLQNLDGDFDNGIIAHEYGHGISNRLTGGPNSAGCLNGDEQMGEGWSDFFSLITTVEPGDQGTDPRGIGNYAQRLPVDGSGIRPRTYTTDMSINEFTYDNVKSGVSIPHGIGTVWCTMIWDLYWAMVDDHGYDADLSNATAGNNIGIQLVMDGMKLQRCSPGFVDGRDAILMADTLNYNAENSCRIWEVFARRGLGYYADQGSSASVGDGTENFETHPLCQGKIRIVKSAPSLIKPGDIITYTIDVGNNRPEEATNVVIKDVVPDGCTYVMGSSNYPVVVDGNDLTFEFNSMASLEQIQINYEVESSNNLASSSLWLDDLEAGEDNWDVDIREGFSIFYLQDEWANSSDNAFFTQNENEGNDQLLFQLNTVKLDAERPGMRFFHWYNTYTPQNGNSSGTDGGLIQISIDNGNSWKFVYSDELLRNGYSGAFPYGTFTIPNLSGFSGDSRGFIDTYVDLEQYKGEDVLVRFRFGSEEPTNNPQGIGNPAGWLVDDIEYLDLYYYNTSACVTSDNGDDSCAELPGKGTLVEPEFGVGNVELPEDVNTFNVYPNPTTDVINIKLDAKTAFDGMASIYNESGQKIWSQQISILEGTQVLRIDADHLSTGVYVVEVKSNKGILSTKVIKN